MAGPVDRDRTFLMVVGLLVGFMLLFGVGAFLLSVTEDQSDQVTLRVLQALGAMFSTICGIVLGYLVGRRNGNGQV